MKKNKEKYKNFSVSIEKKIRKVENDGNESAVTISYKTKFIDSARFMTSSSSKLVDDLPEGIHKIKRQDRNWLNRNVSMTI